MHCIRRSGIFMIIAAYKRVIGYTDKVSGQFGSGE